MPAPAWLPAMVVLGDDPAVMFERLHDVFTRDVVESGLKFRGYPLWWERKVVDQYVEGFYHVITSDAHKLEERKFDPRRAERLSWLAPLLANCADPAIKVWDYKEANGSIHTYVWYEEGQYVIVLRKLKLNRLPAGAAYLLVTAYFVFSGNRAWLQRKFDNRII